MFRLAAVFGAAVVGTLLSWVHFGGIWKGVVVSGAGDIGANGYYQWEPRLKQYVQTQVPTGGWRVPNVYDLVSRGPERMSNARDISIPIYVCYARDNKRNQTRVWYLAKSAVVEYSHEGNNSLFDNTPPSSGWTAVEQSNSTKAGLEPPPEMTVSGNRVAPDPDPTTEMYASSQRATKFGGSSPLTRAAGVPLGLRTRSDAYPGTGLLLVINLAVAYHLWSRRVSPDRVAIGYEVFWEKRQYWRVFTAAFSHYEHHHLCMNAFGIWNVREFETMLGTFRYLCLTINLVVATGAVKILILLWLVKKRKMEERRGQLSLGFSCVLFACITYGAVLQDEYCPFPNQNMCFKTRGIPILAGYFPALRVSFGPFALLVVTQLLTPTAGFVGHLAGVVMGFFVAWGLLGWLSMPIVACMSVMFMVHHSSGWAYKMPGFSCSLNNGWTAGGTMRVARRRAMGLAFAMHVCLAVAVLFLFSWGSGLAEVMTLVVGYNAYGALRCCSWSTSRPSMERFCVNLLKAYGALSAILLISDLLSFGALLGQARLVEYSGVSECSRKRGLVLLVVAAAVHGAAVAACVEAGVMFRGGQVFLSSIGLKGVVQRYTCPTPFSGVGRVLGTGPAEKRE